TRRPLSSEEFSHMVDAARTGPSCGGIPGRDRVMLYYIAAWTGFRKRELGSFTPRHLFLDAQIPYLTVPASYSKRKRNDMQFLHPGLVALLKSWLVKRNPKPEEILFPISKEISGIDRNTAEMIAYDLAAAHNFWIAESQTPEEEKEREQSDFLKYKDSQGKFADFHGLRHTFITNLSLNGVDPKTAQTLARHSTMELTMNVYTHLNDKKQIDAINLLPRPKQE
ncbi:MAG: site-specific integrase, partial [Planctomycetia bacterium]|nr:site-specific integrase [Planctomycetia bacterium]